MQIEKSKYREYLGVHHEQWEMGKKMDKADQRY